MKKLAVLFPVLLVVLVALPLGAQDVTCADIEFDERVMTAYPAAREACQEIIDHEGVKYAHFKALVHEGPPSMLLKFKHQGDTWGPATRINVQPGFTVYMDGAVLPIEDIERGREISIYLPEGRWELAIADAEEPAIAEVEFAPLELEVTDLELPDQVPPPVVEETSPEEVQEAADEAEAPSEEPADEGESEWLWILGLAAAFIIVWLLLRRKKAQRTG